MTPSEIAMYVNQALYLSLLLSMPTIVAASVVGTLVALIQALTQIQEQTLAYGIKLLAVGLTLFITARWMGAELFRYSEAVFDVLRSAG
ncbi:EscS/YscS/HrcS family type III secretion system export apparatus protein [Pandoraea iniqua]|uniref:EscS/YscS/HrcS family type III secretion system export apparatus protein n=1 Tax=Pandoraea iniqua TaxID=2508288 RepID=A0A5E4YH66_9BURK|nr:type III secretion system export apparatus subunit SctS [Pandoraea iniqua]VVE48176.1 EscS/YscS/HrcS family type III secretion system export apparatus protein [Pandoraea iniqua]